MHPSFSEPVGPLLDISWDLLALLTRLVFCGPLTNRDSSCGYPPYLTRLRMYGEETFRLSDFTQISSAHLRYISRCTLICTQDQIFLSPDFTGYLPTNDCILLLALANTSASLLSSVSSLSRYHCSIHPCSNNDCGSPCTVIFYSKWDSPDLPPTRAYTRATLRRVR